MRDQLADGQSALNTASNASVPESVDHQGTLTDRANATRFVDHHGDDVRYVRGVGWFIWNDTRWRKVSIEDVEGLAKETADQIWHEILGTADTQRRAKLAQHATRSASAAGIGGMIRLARSEKGVLISRSDLDRDAWLLNCRNGTLDLRTGKLLPHDREDLITMLAPVDYDPDAECPTWEAFLNRIMDRHPELISFLQRAVGYALTGDVSEQCFFILHGTGANGKSTFIETIRAMMGDYARQADFETLLVRRYNGPREDIARLQGARFVSAIEAEEGRYFAESVIKQLTGGDTISARHLYQGTFEFPPTFKVCLAANHKPVIRGTDHAIWRRIHLVPFTVTIPNKEQDKELKTKLKGERGGILAWAMRGCVQWQKRGLQPPQEVVAATAEYREEMDLVGDFIAERCELSPSAKIAKGLLYEAFTQWCKDQGIEPAESHKWFAARLEEKGIGGSRKSSARYWVGIKVSDG
ncbi:MAG: phage/plasmid primase, P4 family [Candidatus Binatia bacterium]